MFSHNLHVSVVKSFWWLFFISHLFLFFSSLFFLAVSLYRSCASSFRLLIISECGKFLLNQLLAGNSFRGEATALTQDGFTRMRSLDFSSFQSTEIGSLGAIQDANLFSSPVFLNSTFIKIACLCDYSLYPAQLAALSYQSICREASVKPLHM